MRTNEIGFFLWGKAQCIEVTSFLPRGHRITVKHAGPACTILTHLGFSSQDEFTSSVRQSIWSPLLSWTFPFPVSFPLPWINLRLCGICSFTFRHFRCQIFHGTYIWLHGYIVQPFNIIHFRIIPTTASADFSQFVVTTASITVCETSRDNPASLFSSTCLIYTYGLRLPFGLHCLMPAYPPQTSLYQVPVRQATISLSLLLAYTSRCKPWESLWGSSATTPLVDLHHRLTACLSYNRRKAPLK